MASRSVARVFSLKVVLESHSKVFKLLLNGFLLIRLTSWPLFHFLEAIAKDQQKY